MMLWSEGSRAWDHTVGHCKDPGSCSGEIWSHLTTASTNGRGVTDLTRSVKGSLGLLH